MKLNNFKFKKKYGQNFLTDKKVINKIIDVIDIKSNSLVVEIGCGDGRITSNLCKEASFVVGYEIDKELEKMITNNLSAYDNYQIIFDDFMKRNILFDIKAFSYDHIYIFGNLPYYITTPIIEKLIYDGINVSSMTFMVQKEVGDRITSKPNCKEYGPINVYLGYYFDVKKEFVVNRNSFIPKPNVDSVIISLKSHKNKYQVNDEKSFLKLVYDSFRFRRKNLRNNLFNYDLNKIDEVLKKYDLDLTVRAEQLDISIFCDISNNLNI